MRNEDKRSEIRINNGKVIYNMARAKYLPHKQKQTQ